MITERRNNSLDHRAIACITVKSLIILSPVFVAIDRLPGLPITVFVFGLIASAAAMLAFVRWLNYRDGPRCLDPPPVRQPFEADTSAGRGIKPDQTGNAVDSAQLNFMRGSAPESG
jgi:hypothetical protein